jgi:dephospho-CoA kinase
MILPRYIALCGMRHSGKSTVQEILFREHGVIAVDDGWPLRDFAMRHIGLNEWQVQTQEGKATHVHINGELWEVRKILGQTGNALEALFGEEFIPWSVTRNLMNGMTYSFGSVRKKQGWFYKRNGGVVVEVIRGVTHSGNDFDEYDRAAVDYRLINDGSLNALRDRVAALVTKIKENHRDRSAA